MELFIILAISIVAANAQILDLNTDCGRGTDSVDKIVGGVPAKAGDWGWQVAFKIKGKVSCGGAIINNNWIVTAAHCVYLGSDPSYYSFDIGFNDRLNPNSWSTSRNASKVIIHPFYSEYVMFNDIALLKMDSPIEFDTENYRITPVCIPDGSEDYTDRIGYVTGYGYLFTGGSVSQLLRQADVPIKSSAWCTKQFNNQVYDRKQVCAGEPGLEKDTCQGDSGGPLVVRSEINNKWHLVGLTSFGPDPCGNGAVYTRLSGFNSFILSTLKSEGF